MKWPFSRSRPRSKNSVVVELSSATLTSGTRIPLFYPYEADEKETEYLAWWANEFVKQIDRPIGGSSAASHS